jgi:hypothetical protein
MLLESTTVALGLSVASWIALLAFIVKVSMRFGALELKVDTMWGFQMRRSMTEVVTSGMGTLNSPLIISDEVMAKLDPLKLRLIDWYNRYEGRHSDASVLLGIEQEFGNELLNAVCFPCGLSYGACLIIALSVAKQSNEINLLVEMDRH